MNWLNITVFEHLNQLVNSVNSVKPVNPLIKRTKMTIGIKEVEEVAILARLALTQEEKELFARQLSQILEHFKQLEAIDTSGVEPMCHALPVVNEFREDIVERLYSRDELMANAPETENGFFKVPKIGDL